MPLSPNSPREMKDLVVGDLVFVVQGELWIRSVGHIVCFEEPDQVIVKDRKSGKEKLWPEDWVLPYELINAQYYSYPDKGTYSSSESEEEEDDTVETMSEEGG